MALRCGAKRLFPRVPRPGAPKRNLRNSYLNLDRSIGLGAEGLRSCRWFFRRERSRVFNNLGQHDSPQAEIFFANVRMPRNYLLVGAAGYHFTLALTLTAVTSAMAAPSRAVMIYNHGSPAPSLEDAIAAKTFCTQAAFDVANDAVQLFGANGLGNDYPVEKFLRDARLSIIEAGSNDVLGLIAACQMLLHRHET